MCHDAKIVSVLVLPMIAKLFYRNKSGRVIIAKIASYDTASFPVLNFGKYPFRFVPENKNTKGLLTWSGIARVWGVKVHTERVGPRPRASRGGVAALQTLHLKHQLFVPEVLNFHLLFQLTDF